MMKRSFALSCLLAGVVGCQSAPTKIDAVADGATTVPAGRAVIRESDGVVVTSVNGTSTKQKYKVFPAFQATPRYEVPAGPCAIEVEFSGRAGAAAITSAPKTLRFDALPGHSYSLRSRVVPSNGGKLRVDQWDARLVDDAAFVVETSDMPR